MITAGIFQTVEFYVIAVLIAAMIVALVARPASRGEARQYLLVGDLIACGNDNPAITLRANNDGSVTLTRHRIEGITSTGAVSLAVNVIGWDIVIEERLSEGFLVMSPLIRLCLSWISWLRNVITSDITPRLQDALSPLPSITA